MELEDFSKTMPCGLCLKISYTHSEVIEEVVRQALEIVLPNLNLEKVNNHRICKPCYSKLFAAFNFKATCIDTEDAIFPYVSTDKASTIELKEVFLKINGNIELTDTWKKQRICRLCLQLTAYGFVSLNEVDIDIIDTYIPQVKVNATKNPVICASCFNSLRTHGSFLINCLKAHDKFKSADKQPDIKCEIELEDGPELHMIYRNIEEQFNIKSEEIKIKTRKEGQDNDTSSDKLGEKIINKRNHVSEDIGEINYGYGFTSKTKDQLNKNSSENQMYMCNNLENKEELTHKGLPKQKSQQLVHKNPSKIKMYKCDACHYETDRRPNLKIHQNLEKKNEHRMCKPCWSKLFAAYIFKVTCMDNENIISSHVSTDKASTIELKEVYLKVNGKIELTDMWEKQRICRLCLQLVTFDFVSFDEVDNDIIDTYIPHVKINGTKNPVICASCFNSLRIHGSFLINCLKAHDKFKSADEHPDIKCEIKFEDGPDLQMMYKNIEEQFYIKSEAIEIKIERDEDNDTSSYRLGEKIVEKERNHILEDMEETKYASVFTSCEVKDQLNKNSSEIKMHKCEFCTYETKWKYYLKIHQLKHKDSSEVRLYRCDACDYITKHKYALKGHQLLHKNPAEIQMYNCEFCTYKSKRRGNLRSHQLKHKNPSEIQMYSCEACGYKTKYESVMRNHQLLHKDPCEIQIYKCDVCNYETKYKRSLKNHHQFTHTDPSEMKLYKCAICKFETNYKRCLKRHMLLHKGFSEIQM